MTRQAGRLGHAADAMALCALVTAAAADAASIARTIQVSLKVTASCRVNSAALTSRALTRAKREAAVNCGIRLPHALHTSTEPPGAALLQQLGESPAAAGSVRVVTLVF